MTRIMVIDDSSTVLRVAESALREAGYDVLTATDGFAAMAAITDHEPEMIFIDIVMPRLDGYQVCALLKRNRRFRNTPVVMLSSKDGLFDRARGRIVGAQAHINKPFSKAALLEAVRRYAGAGPLGRGADEDLDEDGESVPSTAGFDLEFADNAGQR